jgi:hypothetical protein
MTDRLLGAVQRLEPILTTIEQQISAEQAARKQRIIAEYESSGRMQQDADRKAADEAADREIAQRIAEASSRSAERDASANTTEQVVLDDTTQTLEQLAAAYDVMLFIGKPKWMEQQPDTVWQEYRRKILERRIERAHYRQRAARRDLLTEASSAPNTMYVADASSIERAAEGDAIRTQVQQLRYVDQQQIMRLKLVGWLVRVG